MSEPASWPTARRPRLFGLLRAALVGVDAGVALLVIAAAGLWLASAGDHRVPATVVDDPTLPAITVDGVRLHAEAFGPPDAPLLVVVHGGPGGSYERLLVLAALADRFRVVFYEQRGAGLSERVPDEALTITGYVAELDGIIDRFAAADQPVYLLGQSWGVVIVGHYVAAHPDRVAALVLGEGPYLSPGALEAFHSEIGRRAVSMWPVFRHYAWVWLESLHVRGPDADARQDFFVGHGYADAPDTANPAGAFHCADRVRRPLAGRFGSRALRADRVGFDLVSVEAAMRDFGGPVLLVTGACNTIIGQAFQGRHHLPLFERGEMVVIPGVGHGYFSHQPEATVAAVRAFLTEL